MCEYCHAYPHLPGCPNEPETEREIVGYCGYCDEPIYEGQWKYELGGGNISLRLRPEWTGRARCVRSDRDNAEEGGKRYSEIVDEQDVNKINS